MATPEQVWQSFLVEIQERYDEPFSELIPTDTRGKSAREGAQRRVTKAFTKRALDEIRRRQAADWTDQEIVETLVRNVSNNVERSGGVGAGGPFGWGLTPTNYTLTLEQSSDTDDQAGILFEGLFTERVAADPVDTAFPDPDASLAPVAERGATTGGTVDYHQDAKDLADEASGGRAVPTKIKDVFLVTNAANPQINGYYGPNADGALVLQGDRLEDVDVDEITKYSHGFDLDGKQYRMNNDTGDIEVKETLSGQFGFPGQGVWRSGTIRMVERPEEESIRWGTFTDDTGTWQYDLDNPTDRTLIAKAQQDIGFSTRFNPNTQQYETVRINMRTGEQVGDFLGQSYDTFADTRDFTQRASQFQTTEDRLADQFRQSFGLEQARFGEDVRQFDTRFGEDVRQFDLGFGETQRQFDTQENRMERTLAANNYFNSLEELGRNYRTFIQTAPQMANAATNQGQLIADILRSGGDVLARTYFTRGGISPLPEITQADLINNLNSEMAKIQQFEVDATTAENRRRAAADDQRARDEFTQFKAKQAADARAAYGQYVNEMRPTYAESFDQGGYNTAKAQSDKKIAALNAMKDWLAEPNQTDSAGNPIVDAEAQIADVNAQIAAAQVDPSDYSFTETIQQTPMGFSEWMSSSQYGAPQMGFDQWSTQVGPSFAPTPLLDVPQVPVPDQVTQAELIQQSRATTPPAVASVMAGQMPTPMQFGGLPLPTFQQLQALTPTEQEMLNTRLMTEFNVPLEDVAWQSRRQFGTPSMERNRDLARFRGYAV